VKGVNARLRKAAKFSTVRRCYALTVNQPPPLPVTGEFHSHPSRHHDLVGAAALALGVICAGATAVTIFQWREVGQYRASLPAHATEGAMGFSLHFLPWLLTFCSFGFGVITVGLLAASCLDCHSRRQSQFTFFHISTALLLLPLLYLGARFATVFLR